MKAINLRQAKTHPSRLVEEVAAGVEIVIAKNGVLRAKLVHLDAPRPINVTRVGDVAVALHALLQLGKIVNGGHCASQRRRMQ